MYSCITLYRLKAVNFSCRKLSLLSFFLTLFFTSAYSQESHFKTSAVKTSEVIPNAIYTQKQSSLGDITQRHEEQLSIALTLIAKGNTEYQQKNYDEAMVNYTDALKHFLGDDKSIKEHRGETYTKIAETYKRIKDREKTALFYKKALDTYTALKNQKLMARTLNTLAEAERYLGNYETSLDYSNQSLELHEQINDPEGKAKALLGAGIIYRYIGRYEKSLKSIYEAHLYYKKVNDANGIANTSNQMGLVYTRLKEFDLAKSFYQLTINQSESKIAPNTLASALREMAVINLESGEYESAKVMIEKARDIYKKENSKSNESLAVRILGNVYRAQGDDANAIDYYRKSLFIATEVGSKLYQVKALIPLGAILIGKNTEEAISLLNNALELSAQMHNKSYMLYAYRELRKAKKLQGNIAESLRYAEEEISLSSIIQNEKEDNKFVLEKASLYSHKMEIELELLREKTRLDQLKLAKKNNEIEISEQARMIAKLELTKNKYANTALVSLLILCLLAILYTYRRFLDSKKRNRELHYLAARDPLTNSYNRRTLFEFIDRDFTNLDLLGEYSILMVDIDHFKKINDNYGHSTGDYVISAVANTLQGCVRQNDIVARFGGEEFCIVLPGTTQEKAISIAEIMRQKIETSHFDHISVTCSFGVSSIHFNAKTSLELIEQADIALYKSKALGRNQVTLWNHTLGG